MLGQYSISGLFRHVSYSICSIAVSVLLFSCQSGQDDISASDGQGTVTFSVSNYRQISFDDLTTSYAATRAGVPTDHPSTLAHLLIAVFNAETGQQACSPIQHDQADFTTNSEAYPKFTLTLPYGKYRVLILGYNGSRKCTITSVSHISWEGDYVPNTFLYCENFTLDKNTSLDQKIVLKHVVSGFSVSTEDVMPAELKKMRFSCTSGGTVLNAVTGFTPQVTGRTSEINVPADSLGKPGWFTVYLFLPEKEVSTSYTVQACGKNDNVLYEKQFKNVPLRINTLTLWEGRFFEESADEDQNLGISLYWDTQWADTLTISQ